jgi:hypothetical protein
MDRDLSGREALPMMPASGVTVKRETEGDRIQKRHDIRLDLLYIVAGVTEARVFPCFKINRQGPSPPKTGKPVNLPNLAYNLTYPLHYSKMKTICNGVIFYRTGIKK